MRTPSYVPGVWGRKQFEQDVAYLHGLFFFRFDVSMGLHPHGTFFDLLWDYSALIGR